MGFNFGLGAVPVALATSPGIVPEMKTTDQPNGECYLLESRATASIRGATIHCTDNAERSCSSPATGGTYTYLNDSQVRRELRQMFPKYENYTAAGSHVDVENMKMTER